MAIVVIGGHSRNIGKTSVVCALIAAMPERRWTAIKITQCKHDKGKVETCDCELAGQAIAISEERDADGGNGLIALSCGRCGAVVVGAHAARSTRRGDAAHPGRDGRCGECDPRVEQCA